MPMIQHSHDPPDPAVGEQALRRRDLLLAAGYPPPLAADIACSGADVYVALTLVARGCDVETATEIVV